MLRRHQAALGALVLLVTASPFLPDTGDEGQDAPERIGAVAAGPDLTDATAVAGAVTPDLAAEIDRVVAAGRTAARPAVRPAGLVRQEVRCADFEGQGYCLHTGWTDRSESEVVSEAVATATAARRTAVERTGDAGLLTTVRAHARRSPAAQARAERAELERAAASVAKVWLLRHQIQGVPLPEGFLARHPEVRTTDGSARTAATGSAPSARKKTSADYPRADHVMKGDRIREQNRSYWCGPSAMQSIGWGWHGSKRAQSVWARRLGTTTSGSALSALVRMTNEKTGWDRASRAGRYVVLDIADWSYDQWFRLQMRHVTDYRAPLVLHPILVKRYYPYLDDDASGHFQVGRGYNKRGSKSNLIRYLEPWNQQRFDPSEPYIARRQERSAYKSYRANQDHPHHNIGV